MVLQRNTTLSKEARKIYTERLIKLHGIIADAPPEQYDHRVYVRRNGFWKRVTTGCGTAACAIGHACLHADEFPGFEVHNVEEKYGRAAAREFFNGAVIAPTDDSRSYFGPGSYQAIFHLGAYNKPDEEVTKIDALNRIEDYITKVLGCDLLPIT